MVKVIKEAKEVRARAEEYGNDCELVGRFTEQAAAYDGLYSKLWRKWHDYQKWKFFSRKIRRRSYVFST